MNGGEKFSEELNKSIHVNLAVIFRILKQELKCIMFKIGCHLSLEGGYASMGKRILSIGGNTFQFFTKNPKGGRVNKPADPYDVAELNKIICENGLTMPLAHAPYTYNPCSADEGVRNYSRDSMRGELEFLEYLPGSLYNFHPGCHVKQGVEVGVALISDMLSNVLWKGMKSTVLLETMSGKGTEIGRSFEELAMIIDKVPSELSDNLGVCLDTCHIHDGGYDLTRLDDVLDEFDRIVGLERIRAIHLNDSMNPRASHKDRHAKIGEGTITLEVITEIINNPRIAHLPFYLETPNELDGYAREIALLKKARRV